MTCDNDTCWHETSVHTAAQRVISGVETVPRRRNVAMGVFRIFKQIMKALFGSLPTSSSPSTTLVFQSKVFQKLYLAPPKPEKEPSPPSIVRALSRKTHVKRKASERDTSDGDAGRKRSAADPGKRMYTVLPPPADHKTDSEKSVTLQRSESINSAADPPEGSVRDGDEEPGQDKEEEEPQRRRKRRKRKPALRQGCARDGAAGVSESGPGQSRAPEDEVGENMSRNKRRKLKKKRHREKLLAMGLMPRAAALEFTYRKEEEEEEEDNETRDAEVSRFLRTTMEIYMSDPSLRSDLRPLLGGAVNNLLSRVAEGCHPPGALRQLSALKALAQRRQADELEKALVELVGTSPLSSEETDAVVSLFRYWIAHVLPPQVDEKASSSDARRGSLADRAGHVFQSAETDSGLHPAAAGGDSFHTPPASPQTDGPPSLPDVPSFLQRTPPPPPLPPHPPSGPPVSSPPPVPVPPSSGKKAQPSSNTTTTTTAPIAAPDGRPRPPLGSNSFTFGPGVGPVKSGVTVGKGQEALGRNGGPPTSTPRPPAAQGKSPASPCSASPVVVGGSSVPNGKERDSGLSRSLLGGQEGGGGQGEALEKLLEECRSTLGITASQDGTKNTAEVLKHLLTEVKSLRCTLQTERGDWLQFQADLQVAVAVADRLRAEAEEELTSLRSAHEDVERELAASQQRQKEADTHLVTLRGELKQSRQRLAALAQAPRPEPQGPNGEATDGPGSNGGTPRGRERAPCRPGRGGAASVTRSVDDATADCRGVTQRYLRNVTKKDRGGEEARRTAPTERSRSLSRLPACSGSPSMQNGTSQPRSASTVGLTNKNSGSPRGQSSLDWQDSRSTSETGKRGESLNKHNALAELPPTKSQDGFNLLLRRHGGSKRNSLLRWCQSRTHGYENIDITNFSSSWADGLAFCAVYHTYLPSHVPYAALTPENKRENLSLAFKTGEAVGIEQMLTVEEMQRAGGPDWQRVLSYVENIYRHFEMCPGHSAERSLSLLRPNVWTSSMDGIWALVVCLAVPGLSLNSSRPLFLISGPEVVHAGTPTSLAITVLADFPGRVTAEVAHGNTKVAQTEDFRGGLTSVLTIPPIPGTAAANSALSLTVSFYRENRLVFTNTTALSFSPRNVSTFIQTDRSLYQPGDSVKVRLVSVRSDNRPYRGRVDLSLQDPGGNVVDRWDSTGNAGIVVWEVSLSHTISNPVGQWVITSTIQGVTDARAFTVEHYEHPLFEVLLRTPSQVLVGDDLSGSVRAFYPSGKPVQGTLTVTVGVDDGPPTSSFLPTQTTPIFGSTPFWFSKDLLQGTNSTVQVSVCVTDNSTGLRVNKTARVRRTGTAFRLTFHDAPPALKPSLLFAAKLRVSRYDGEPLSAQDATHDAVIEVTQRTSTVSAGERTTLTLPVPEDGDVHIGFKLREQIAMLFIRARFQSSEETLTVFNDHASPTDSYVQISSTNSSHAQIGIPLQVDVTSTFPPTEVHFVVSSKGQVLAAGTTTSSSFSLTPTVSWSPEACVTVYCILPDGEVTMDTAHIPINQQHYASLSWSSDKAQPGEQVSLTATALEPASVLGVVVTGSHDDAPPADLDLKVEQECNIRMLTNARVHQKNKPDRPTNDGADLTVEKYWSHWMDAAESLLWFDTSVTNPTWTSGKVTVPDGVTRLNAFALVMSDNQGLGFSPVPQRLTVSKDFSLSLDVPSFLHRGEEIVLEVNVINHLEHDIEVIVLLAQSEAFEFVLADKRDAFVVNSHKLTIGSHSAAPALFPIRPVVLGEMEVSVEAVSAEASDTLVWRLLVKPEGVEQSFSETLFLEMAPTKYNSTRSVSFSFPPDVVAGSQRAHVALVGDILAMSIRNLDSLLQKPVGCGEQNMVRFAPCIYVIQYLDKSTADRKEIRSRALGYMMEGYQRQLSFQRDDGSFSAFGASDTTGSTWLTAFVVRCFLQAQPYMQVDPSVLARAVTWLLKLQGPQGEFGEVGRLISTEMHGGLDNSSVGLTAYVLMALLEDGGFVDMYPGNVSLARTYLENQVSSGAILSNYSLCLVAYALALAKSNVADTALQELYRRAEHTDGVMMWGSSAGLGSHDWQPRSAQIEMTSYVLLALYRRGSFVDGIKMLKWLSKQRNHLGGYGTTQDTVVALQALAVYAAFSGAIAIDLRLNVSAPASSFESLFSIDSTTYLTLMSREINSDKDLNLNIYMEGRGFALFQMNIFYNLETKAFSQDKEAFALTVDVTGEVELNHMLLSICTALKGNQVVPNTGMVIVDVGMLSGFRLSAGAAASDLIRKVEILPEKVSLYLDSVSVSSCPRFMSFYHFKPELQQSHWFYASIVPRQISLGYKLVLTLKRDHSKHGKTMVTLSYKSPPRRDVHSILCPRLQLNKSEVCIRLPVIRDYKVAHVQDAAVHVYDYYEPSECSHTSSSRSAARLVTLWRERQRERTTRTRCAERLPASSAARAASAVGRASPSPCHPSRLAPKAAPPTAAFLCLLEPLRFSRWSHYK
ncbi:CD109 antigen [Spinachia spinachia]